MLARVRRGGIDVVLVWKFSRFTRSVRHLVTALDEFKTLGVDFVSITEGIDTTSAVGKLTFHIIAAIDEFFLDTLCENRRAGLAAARRRGKRLGRPRAERRHADQRGPRLDVDAARDLLATGVSRREAAGAREGASRGVTGLRHNAPPPGRRVVPAPGYAPRGQPNSPSSSRKRRSERSTPLRPGDC